MRRMASIRGQLLLSMYKDAVLQLLYVLNHKKVSLAKISDEEIFQLTVANVFQRRSSLPALAQLTGHF